MEYLIIIAVVLVLFFAFIFREYYSMKKRFKDLVKKAEVNFGRTDVFDPLTFEDFEVIRVMFDRYQIESDVDEITASDLEIDRIFEKFNVALSAPGREYFYKALRSPEEDESVLRALNEKVEYLRANETARRSLYTFFIKVGFLKKANFFKCLDYFDEIPTKSLLREYLSIILLVISIVLTCISPSTFVLLLIAILIFNIVTYYAERGKIEPYIICLQYIINFIKQSNEFSRINIDALKEEREKFSYLSKKLSSLQRNTSMLSGGVSMGAGNPLELIADYLRMFLHLDIIVFYRMLRKLVANKAEVEEMYCLIGRVEYYLILASMRESLPEWCIPEKGKGINTEEIYHPLIKEPVKNNLSADRGIVITGSNASGKSTFLKTVALNAIFAKTIYTCTAKNFASDNFCVFSSMSLRDDLLHEDSYFMVEIKALKRILDFAGSHPDKKVLCFVDEVLRGTNTIERIAACTKILESISKDGIVCFAATHDIELTDTLSDFYDNYHFDETIEDNDILFNYELKKGKATSRNAIKLLSIMGYSPEIVDSAQKMAETFINEKIWRT